MPRYIDAEKLLEKAEEIEWFNEGTGYYDLINIVHKYDVETAPTADVVPESEVERLRAICNSYALQYGTVRDQQKVIDEAKREIAREIFEEISKASVDWGCYCVTLSKGAFLAEDVNRTLTELKKKYTEERPMKKNNNRWKALWMKIRGRATDGKE